MSRNARSGIFQETTRYIVFIIFAGGLSLSVLDSFLCFSLTGLHSVQLQLNDYLLLLEDATGMATHRLQYRGGAGQGINGWMDV